MKKFIYALVLLLAVQFCLANTENFFCPQRLVNVGVFNTFGDDTGGSLLSRMQALGGYNGQGGLLLQAFEREKLDVLCLPDTYSNSYRDLLFSGFTNYTVYVPGSVAQPGCKNACFTNVTYNAYNFTLPINKWVEYCSLTPVPGLGISCSQTTSEVAYEQCILNFCPFLLPFIEQVRNLECIYCLTSPVEGESRTSRIFKCSATYIDTDAANCKFALGGSFSAPVIFRNPPVEKDVFYFPSAVNPQTDKGVVYAKINTTYGNVNVFCTHLLQGALTKPNASDPNLPATSAQAKSVLEYVASKSVAGEPSILIGDFNAGERNRAFNITGVWTREVYKQFTKAGFVDAFFIPVCTFGCNGVFPSSPVRQSIDHIFFKGKTNNTFIYPFNSDRFLTKRNIIYGNTNISASDHYGVRTTFCRKPHRDQRFFARPLRDFNKPVPSREQIDRDNDDNNKAPPRLPLPIPQGRPNQNGRLFR